MTNPKRHRKNREQRKWYYKNLSLGRKVARDSYKKQKENRYGPLRVTVFTKYCKGKIRCMCKGCPIKHIDLLTLDHILGNGYEHKDKGGYRISGYKLLVWIVKNRFPKGFQVLCWSCNACKGNKKRCSRYGFSH